MIMKHGVFRILFATLALSVLSLASAAEDLRSLVFKAPPEGYKGLSGEVVLYDRSHAVVIGISRYERLPELPGAVRDAEKVAEALRNDHQFEVTLLLDQEATRLRIAEVLGDQLPLKLGRNDRVLVYFAGHGVTVGQDETAMGYLMPVEGDNERRVSTGISMRELQAWFAGYRSKHVMFVADACYSGLALSTRSVGLPTTLNDYLRQVTERPVRLSLTAGRADQEAHEWRGQGLFTFFLLEALSGQADVNGDGIVTSSEIYAYLEPNVAMTALQHWRARQNPQLGRSGEGEFIFLIDRSSPTEMTEAPQPAISEAAEITFWRSIEGSSFRQDFEAYLERFPAGIFSDLARFRLERLADQNGQEEAASSRTAPPVPTPEVAATEPLADRSTDEVRLEIQEQPRQPSRILGQAQSQEEAAAWDAIQSESQLAERIRMGEEFLRRFPESGLTPFVHYALATAFRYTNEPDKFIRHGEKAVDELSALPDILSHLAFLYSEMGQKELAEESAMETLRLMDSVERPQNVSPVQWATQQFAFKGEAFYALGRVHLARATESSGDADARNNSLEEAARFFERALEQAPHHQFAAFRLAETLLIRRDPQGAGSYFARAAALGGVIGDQARMKLSQLLGESGSSEALEDLLAEQKSVLEKANFLRLETLKQLEEPEPQRRPTLFSAPPD
jgi:tetratricopeptide (TPR) repeat protein